MKPFTPVFSALAALFLVTSVAAQSEPVRYYEHRAASGETLIGLGERFLVDPKRWPDLQKLNRIANPRAIPVNSVVRIPLDLMKTQPQNVQVVAVQGNATANGAPLAAGTALSQGADIQTGKDGYVTVQLADGSQITLQSATSAKLESAKNYGGVGVFESVVRLLFGRVETRVAKQGGSDRFEVKTPTASMGVRGTQFRASSDESGKIATSEVTEGKVAAAAAGIPSQVALNAGFGTRIEEGKAPLPPVALIPAPNTATLPGLQERTLIRFRLDPLDRAASYRAQVALDRDFQRVVAEVKSNTPEIRVTDLPDGNYFLRVRGVDALSIEGIDAVHPFRLKARPEPPFVSTPQPNAKVAGETHTFSWTQPTEAAQYRFQLAKDDKFANLIADASNVTQPTFTQSGLQPGQYYWRIASTRSDGDKGPFGDPVTVTVRPGAGQLAAPSVSGDKMMFAVSGEAGQKFEFRVARDPKFQDIIATSTFDTPNVELAKPKEAGVYYIQYRAIDPDGFAAPFSAAQRIEVPVQPWWLLLASLPINRA